jgi:two-component system, NarL family, nitrate/nitrite response regulator NarL
MNSRLDSRPLPRPAFAAFEQPCVLLVDDHQLFRTGMRMIVQSFVGMGRVLEAGSVMQARALAAETVDVIFLDVQMPGLSGLEGLAVLQKSFPAAHIIFLSASATAQTLAETQALGAKGYLPKSASAEDIEEALRKVLTGGTCFAPPPASSPSPVAVNSNTDSSAKSGANALSVRQKEVLALLAQGLPNKVIARQLNLSENTVRIHVGAVFAHFGVNSRTAAVLAAQQAGMVGALHSGLGSLEPPA